MEVLSCGHCSFQTQKIRRLELHLKSKHTTKNNDSDAEFIDLEDELFQEMESEVRPNLIEDPATLKEKNVSTKDSESPTGSVIPGPKPASTSPDTQCRTEPSLEFKSLAAFKCNICDFSSDSTRSISIHKFKSHGFQKRFIVKSSETKCHQCPFEGSSPMSLKVHQHRKGHFPNRETPPKSEVAQTPISGDVTQIKEDRGSSDSHCSKCPFVGTNKSSLQNHFYRAHKKTDKGRPSDGVEEVPCPECVFIGWNQKSLTTHISRAHRSNAVALLAMASKMKANRDVEDQAAKKRCQPDVGGTLEGSKSKIRSKTPKTATTPIQIKTEAAENSFKAENKLALPKSEPTEVLDILKGFIRCPACQFMCNSLRSMGEHVAAVHSTSVDVPPAKKADNAVVDSDNGKVTSDNKMTTSDPNSGETKQANTGKNFPCSNCGAVYSRPDSLRRHCKQLHEGQGVQSNPKTHQPPIKEEIGAPVRPIPRKSVPGSIPCPTCHVNFSSKANLKRHTLRFHPADKEGDLSEAVGTKATAIDEDLDVEILEG